MNKAILLLIISLANGMIKLVLLKVLMGIYYSKLKEPGKEEKPLVILIEALDELDKTDIPFSPPFPTPLPPNVFVIASARASEGEKPEYLSGWTNDVEPIHLDRLPRCAIADWLKQTGDGELAVFAEDI